MKHGVIAEQNKRWCSFPKKGAYFVYNWKMGECLEALWMEARAIASHTCTWITNVDMYSFGKLQKLAIVYKYVYLRKRSKVNPLPKGHIVLQ